MPIDIERAHERVRDSLRATPEGDLASAAFLSLALAHNSGHLHEFGHDIPALGPDQHEDWLAGQATRRALDARASTERIVSVREPVGRLHG